MSDGGGNRWLRGHFHEFVFPAFVAAEKRTTEIGKPFHVKASPQAPENLPSELKKLWTLCMEMDIGWEFNVREIAQYGGHSKYRESARIHHSVIVNTLDSALAAIRDEGCTKLFLGGRDVWAFAVCCARRRIPFLFIPELSRYVTGKPQIRTFLESRGFTGEELFLDTGFAGSIPRNLQKHWPDLDFRFRLMSQSNIVMHQEAGLVDTDPVKESKPRRIVHERWRSRPQQLFPNRKKAREEALETEYLAKYWKTGTYEIPLPMLACAPRDMLEKWMTREGVYKFTHKPGYAHVCDGKEVAEVSLWDAKQTAPDLFAWMEQLPERPAPEERVVQFFSDRRTIQRAALLTSMLWRGIPFWKAAMNQKAAAKAQQWSSSYSSTGTESDESDECQGTISTGTGTVVLTNYSNGASYKLISGTLNQLPSIITGAPVTTGGKVAELTTMIAQADHAMQMPVKTIPPSASWPPQLLPPEPVKLAPNTTFTEVDLDLDMA
jgi:hypothetical protein